MTLRCCIFLMFLVTQVTSKHLRRYEIVDSFLNGLKYETWSSEEATCLKSTEAILHGVKNNTLWANWVWDSMQLPVGIFYGNLHHLGNFDQCIKVPWNSYSGLKTQYCLADVTLTDLNDYDGETIGPYDDADTFIGAKFRLGKRTTNLLMGVCVPATCKPASIAKISRTFFKLSHLPFKNITINPTDCQATDILEKSMGYYIFWYTLVGMTTLCILYYIWGDEQEKSDSTVSRILQCFCPRKGLKSLIEVRNDEVKAMNAIRGITSVILVVGHFFFLSQLSSVINKIDAEKALSGGSYFSFAIHTEICVETFFVMSGLLFARSCMSSRTYQPFRLLLKRYLRLVFPLLLLITICIGFVLPHTSSGPLWPRLVESVANPCIKSWWKQLLMISNNVDDSHCLVTTWYVHTDFQLAIFGTFIYILYHKNKKLGFIVAGISYVISIVVPFIWNYWEELPALLLYDFGPESQNMATNRVYSKVYKPVYTRASSYLIGMTMGYLMSVYRPQDYKNAISKVMSIIIFVIGMSFIIWPLYMGSAMLKREMSAISIALLPAVDKSIWSIGICLIIFVCEYGTFSLLTKFLSFIMFVPLSKLSYSIYLIHVVFLLRYTYSIRTPNKYDAFDMIIHGIGHAAVTLAICFFVWLFVETPASNMITLLFERKKNAEVRKNEPQIKGMNNNRVIKNGKML